jgi:hypothetical protein
LLNSPISRSTIETSAIVSRCEPLPTGIDTNIAPIRTDRRPVGLGEVVCSGASDTP